MTMMYSYDYNTDTELAPMIMDNYHINPLKISRTKSQQGKSEGFDSCDRPSNLTQIGLKSSIFPHVWPWNLMDDLEK